MNELKKNGVGSYESVKTFIINPKSLKDGELYGEYDLSTGEWLDGRNLCNCQIGKQIEKKDFPFLY